MASIANLFGFEQIEADSGLDPTLIFKLINKDREEYLRVLIKYLKASTLIQQMVFLTSWKL